MIIGEAGAAARALWGDVFDTPGRVYGGGKGGQFKMDPEELAAVIGQWEDLLDKIVDDGEKIKGLRFADRLAPGQDPASDSYASTTGDSISALQRQNDSMRKYAQAYIKKLKEAQSKTVVTDQDLSDTFKA
ncbi:MULTISPECIES: hypothetical protein [unclassified Amycolatopsis]|uniref:hypothetical protein n=1 Tax=unclassified Amycolatopsis TaxID=2618356 RepID=UPI002875772B|nr:MULTISPECIES: hypothetical protein [unclassified Amycolatopsis]MDS0137031.1 hypothetical protein [Amycolatopsis sp. 505]MDS0143696.1 hypothetical protein [Amycolatopsis sp. CM201R]